MKLQWPLRRETEPASTKLDNVTIEQLEAMTVEQITGLLEQKGLTFTPQTAAWEFGLPGSRLPGSNVDFAAEVKNGMYSSVVTSALCWMMRTFPEAPVVVQQLTDERWETVAKHDLARLLRTPNPEYNGRVLWASTIMDFCFGEAFWRKVKNGKGEIKELWWLPRTHITPFPNPETGLLDHYLYQPAYPSTLPQEELKPSEVVHFRFGKNPNNLLRGFSPLAAVMREVFTDDQAANFTAAILKNLGIIGIVFSPSAATTGMSKEQAEKFKDYVQSAFTGDKRGQAMFFTQSMTAQLLQYNMQGFDVGPIRDIAEERVCAALAIPAAVIGFGTGLQQTKVGATMREMVKLAWQGGIEPVQAIMADELDRSLLTEFHTNKLDDLRCHFDTSQVEALTESPAEKTDRVIKLTEGNILTIAQAQRELGYPVDTKVDKYLRELIPGPAAKPTVPLPRNRLAADASAAQNYAPAPGETQAPATNGASQGDDNANT